MSGSDHGIRVTRQKVALVATIDRPQAKNAISRATALELMAIANSISGDTSLRALVITGGGGDVFVSGGDLREFAPHVSEPHGARHVLEMAPVLEAFEACEVPVIAAIQGAAFGGGCELSLACDLVLLEAHAFLQFRQAAVGLSTGWGGGTRLVERVGPMVAARVLFLGDAISAPDAVSLGLANEVVPRGSSVEVAVRHAGQIARHSRSAIAGLKQMLLAVRKECRGNALSREAEVFASLWGGPAHREAMDAFLAGAKRKP